MLHRNHAVPPQAPVIFTATVQSIHQDNKIICDNTRALLNSLTKNVTPEEATFNNVLRPLANDENQRQLVSNMLSLHLKVSTDPALREASAEAEKERSHFMIDCTAREDIFRLIESVYQKNQDLDTESIKLLREERRRYIRNGLGLPSETERRRLKDIRKRLGTISSKFIQNLDDVQHEIWLSPEELAGVPDAVVDRLGRGVGCFEGKVKITSKESDIGPLMQFVLSPEVRRRILEFRLDVGKENVPLFAEAVGLRHEAAQILGYDSHAALRLEDKMAKTPETVMTFLNDLCDRAFRNKSKDVEELLHTKQADLSARGLPIEGELYKWDLPFYTRLLKEKEYSIDVWKIAEYFPLHPTVNAMLSLFGNLMGFLFIEIKDDEDRAQISPTGNASDITWHEDVILYNVWNDSREGNEFAGYLYLDLHPRHGKFGGAQCYPLQLGFSHSTNGDRHYPSTVLLTNFAKPTKDKPSLLKHNEVVMLFHELGHGMHDLSGRCQYSRFHGAETVSDFNEAPSQMLENWCWDSTGLKSLSSHYETGEPLPDGMIEAIIRTKRVQPSLGLLQQLRMCLFDMAIHDRRNENEELDFAAVYSDYVELDGINGTDDRDGYATWRHLCEGYDAGMYSYLWSKVIASDMFDSVFRRDPMDRAEGGRYRHMVLEKGGSQDEIVTLVDFLGREPRSDAFFDDLGLD
ncbi:peptidase family M3 [Massarina eburnea CBS 473.64]|uniref:Peptidase family M3 n=1 Tax=Massarina eburnea CBS 473.64 TaxID=1395130 RepID=A0A6A6RQP9_9PLEO|nr:peptidase family M3 [Massarina eburnea CBS 473.64]